MINLRKFSVFLSCVKPLYFLKFAVMKRILQFGIFLLFVLFLSGCHSSNKKSMDVIVDGNGIFPENVAGIWRSDNDAWEFDILPDGKIAWAIISLGYVKIEPGKTTRISKEGVKGVFEPGLWTVWYLQKQRELTVEITINHFRTEHGKNIIHGKTRDIFTGSVSQDGTLWYTQRFSYPEYIVDTKKYHEYKLPVDPNENPKENLLFRKIKDNNK
jgi:hypothetical protein